MLPSAVKLKKGVREIHGVNAAILLNPRVSYCAFK